MSEKVKKRKARELETKRSQLLVDEHSRETEATWMHLEGGTNEEIQLLQYALRVAGSPAKLAQWASTPITSLHGQTPYAAMQSPQGRQDVAAVLTRIEHGVY